MTPPVLLCNTLYRVLTPPAGDVLATLQSGHPRFAELVRAAKMEMMATLILFMLSSS